MTDGFILMKSGSQWNLVRVEDGDGTSVGAILTRPLAERIVELLNRFGEEDRPLPIDESQAMWTDDA
jgi:hypothetical protein